MKGDFLLMRVRIKRIDTSLSLPMYATFGSVGCDLSARIDVRVRPKALTRIPTNVIVQTPPEYMFLVTLRSSTPQRLGLIMPNSVGVIDQDYCGPEDEIAIPVYNIIDAEVVVKRGDRFAQGIFVHVDRVEWEEVTTLARPTRGGFGSTGENI